jgi:hypothetical protein
MIDLQQFCGTDETRWYLMKPFSQGEHSFATNGHIEVRIPRRDDITELDDKAPKFDANAPLAGIDEAAFSRFDADLPPAPTEVGPCKACDGRGYEHACPDCECVCEMCHGSGDMDQERFMSTTIAGIDFTLSYVRQMLALPGVEIAQTAATATALKGMKPLFFRFDGGVGALMPRRGRFEKHVEIERKDAA